MKMSRPLAAAVASALSLQVVILSFPLAAGRLIDLLRHGSWHAYLVFLAVMLVLPLMQGLFEWLKALYTLLWSERAAARLRGRLLANVLLAPMSYFSTSRTGEVVTRCTDDVQQLSDYDKLKLEVVEHSAVFLIIGTALYRIHPLLLALMGLAGAIALLQTRVIAPAFSRLYRQTSEMKDEYNEYARERIELLPLTKISGRSQWELNKLAQIADRTLRIQQRTATAVFWNDLTLKAIESCITGSIYALAAYLLLHGDITLGSLFAVATLYYPLMHSLQIASQWVHRIKRKRIAASRVVDIGALERDACREGEYEAPRVNRVEFRGVSFAYGNGTPVLEDVSFTLERGKTVALVGMSGGGKSTLCELLMKLQAPTAGEIVINGSMHLSDVNGGSWRRRIGYVPQSFFAFSDSIRANLLYGSMAAAGSDVRQQERLEAMSSELGLHDIIKQRPEGYDTPIRSDATGFSGGQRQRMSLLRTLMRDDTDIFVLDEPTSALDYLSEKKVMGLLEDRQSSRATLIVAHRLSTIIHADSIIVLKDGKIAESGTHIELMSRRGAYYSLYEHELRHAEAESEVPYPEGKAI